VGKHLLPVTGTTGVSTIEILFLAGLIAGSIDLAAATALAAFRSVLPKRVLQGIASALIGPRAFRSRGTAALGFALHFVIAFTVATIYVIASRYLPFLTRHAIASGLLYGVLVHLVMTFIVLPLTALKRPFSMAFFLGQLVIHAFCVGLPVALVARHLPRFG
jgi:uncharacterized membrane protein YagU involved in acid resistance